MSDRDKIVVEGTCIVDGSKSRITEFAIHHEERLRWVLILIRSNAYLNKRPYAMIFDIDEVLICNLRYPGSDPHDCKPYSYARELLTEALKHSTVFLVTGRRSCIIHETVHEFGKIGMEPTEITQYDIPRVKKNKLYSFHTPLTIPSRDIGNFKKHIHHLISEHFHVFLNVGDQLTDMSLIAEHEILLPQNFYVSVITS